MSNGRKSYAAPASNTGNGGMLGSGIFGMFGTTIHCDAESDSYYCMFMKFFNVFMVLGMICFVLFLVYNFMSSSNKR